MSIKTLCAAIALAMASSIAMAGNFSYRGYGSGIDRNLGSAISDLVTDKFTRTFDSNTHGLAISYENFRVGEDTICYATVGVSRVTPQNRTQPIPEWQASAIIIKRNVGSLTGGQKEACMIEVVRNAVKDLMSKDAAVLKANTGASL